MQKKYILCIVLIMLTIISTILTIPKVKIIDEYKDRAINPIDKQIVQIDDLLSNVYDLTETDNAREEVLKTKSVMSTAIQLAIFDKSLFSSIFIWVLVTSILYILLTFQSVYSIIKELKNDENIIIIVLLITICLLSITIGTYFIGILVILISALLAGIASCVKS
ncbi:hypothetical protein HMPREF1084_02575 [Clostridium butyricum 60E.3]|uniref:hypothetical protein n=1 Tax=Clostridium butyricum TaxID=1492 RepID=UPI0002D15682|nr:hypothetical protein [Clostridium butyricum]ENZ32161.1 hypothetical protein HMPREF1084_02575 [Clostridium butyricum 60E.3]